MAIGGSKSKRVKRIFQQFDANCDGVLKRRDLVVAVNPKVERVKRRKSVCRRSVSSKTARRYSPAMTC